MDGVLAETQGSVDQTSLDHLTAISARSTSVS